MFYFIAIVLLFIASSFFSGSETALTAANKIKIQARADAGDKKSQRLLKTVKNTEEFIAGILIANNIPNIILPSLVTIVALEYGWNVGVSTAILTVLIIIFAEVLPKSVAAAYPDRLAYVVYPITRTMLIILKPFTVFLNALTRVVIKMLGRDEDNQASFSKEEMRTMVDIGHDEGTFKNEEMHRLKGMLDFETLNVADVMQTPRIHIQGIPADTDFETARSILNENQFSRYPIYDGDLDHIVGVFHTKFFVGWTLEPDKLIKDFSDLNPLYVYEFQPVQWVFKQMLQEKKHFAIVHDEYGGTEGIITHEDLIETMIGQDIEDETDLDDKLIGNQTEHEIVCDGKITLRRLNNAFNTNIPEGEDNLAGFILNKLGYVPEVGESLYHEELTFEILSIDDKRIETVLITKEDLEVDEEDSQS
ncbi:CNNM domain-containing protein [Geomicrobium sediminis]|uniref:Mg2+/Co2+ transporter CorB n=1 Tax=Geomicrobium sediminis TaxID=1347788 RepID=A0ABS2PDW0_9BACL|nr:Mg2+/Co2+ transporter CorB [Geomicrobium sediminis]